MVKVFIPAPNEDWIGDITTSEFCSKTLHQIVSNHAEAEIIFLYSKWIWNHVPFETLVTKPCITTVHHIVPEKARQFDFTNFDRFTDVYHVPNGKTEEMLRRYTNKRIKILPYWINQDRWYATDDDTVSNDKIILASFQRDTEGSSLGPFCVPKPKLEKGPDIFVDIVRRFRRDEVIPLVPGWRRDYIKDALASDYDLISSDGKLAHGEMNALYNDVRKNSGYYLVTSRYEGGPQAIIEAAQTRTKILSTDVGVAPDVLHPDCICHSVDDFERKIRSNAIEHTVEFNFQKVQELKMDNIIPVYDEFIKDVFNEKAACQ